ncbi:hypothetical protein ALC53_04645 [Atta colombica]|uniref:Uncharacterized protein n=1 Tax=Atta colombica TaxID=520822 RepID=A0A195BL45_9HYME|nr:hypothetical protein ALC53_04645 [Atta colombica]
MNVLDDCKTRQLYQLPVIQINTAFKVMCHQYIRPPILMTIIVIVIRTTSDEKISKPINKKVTTNIASNEIPILCNVSGHIVRYCS